MIETDDMIIYLENPKSFTDKLLELLRKYGSGQNEQNAFKYLKYHKIYKVSGHKYIKIWAMFLWRKHKPKMKDIKRTT